MAPRLGLVLAQAADPASGVSGWVEYGVLGLLVAAFLTGVVVPGFLYKRVEAENDRLRSLIDDKVYPLVERSTAATEEAVRTMRELSARRRS